MRAPEMTMDDLERKFDGPIPQDLLRLAKAAPKRVLAVARTRLNIRHKAKVLQQRMADVIVEVHQDRGGEVAEADLLLAGFTPEEIATHRGAAMQQARGRLRQDREGA